MPDHQEPGAGYSITYHRNYNSSDSVEQTRNELALVPIETLGFTPPQGYRFKEWNAYPDGTGYAFAIGDSSPNPNVYAIWEAIDDMKQWYERPKNVTVAKYRLTANGLCMSSSSYSMYKYYVTAGEILYLYLNDVVVSSASQNVYQFQSAETIPTSGTNSALIGTPVSGAVDAYVEVPEGATYLVVSQLTSSTNFKVCATLPDIASISSVTPLDQNTYEIKDKVARQAIPFGTTDFSSTSTAYTATVEGITELRSGVACYIMNTKVTSASGFTININGLGAKPVYLVTAAASRATTQFAVNYTWLLVYNENRVAGGCWDMVYLYNSDNNTIGYNIRNYSGSLKAKAAIYRYMLLLSIDETYVVPINSVSNSTATTKTLTTESFDPFGPIYYYSTTTTISSGSTIGASYRWTQYAIDLRYSFNTGSTLTTNKVVYIVADPQSDGKAKLASSPISQDLPSTADGKIYIRLGIAYSEYQVQMENNHPVYFFKDGAIRLWTNPSEIDEPIENIVSTTYTELKSARDNGELIPGVKYRITDYVTIINGTYDLSTIAGQTAYLHYAKSAGHPFDLIVMALDESTLDEHAIAILHSGDSYFSNSALERWDIRYTIDNDSTRYSWADATNGKGVITYLKDEFDNEAPYDFKNIQFLLYALKMENQNLSRDSLCYDSSDQPNRYGSPVYVMFALASLIGEEEYTYSSPFKDDHDFACSSNILGTVSYSEVDATYLSTFNADWYYTFDMYNNGEHTDYSLNVNNSVLCFNNNIAQTHDMLAAFLAMLGMGTNILPFGLNACSFENNDIVDLGDLVACYDNNIGADSLANVIGSSAFSIKIGAVSYANLIGSKCKNINIGADSIYISICNGCFNILFDGNNSHFELKNGCNSIHIGSYSSEMFFGHDCSSFSIGQRCTGNSFQYECNGIVFGEQSSANTVGLQCTNITLGSSCYSNTFGVGCYNISLGNGSSINIFAGNVTSVTLFTNCSYNTFNSAASNSTLFDHCSNNTLGGDGNVLKNGCSYNTINGGGNELNNNCSNNVITTGAAYNVLGSDCQNNRFEDNSFYNTIGNHCQYCSFNGALYNIVMNDVLSATFGSSCNSNIVGESSANITFSSSSSNNTVGAHVYKTTLSSTNYYHIVDGYNFNYSASIKTITGSSNNKYEIWVGTDSDNIDQTWCPADIPGTIGDVETLLAAI